MLVPPEFRPDIDGANGAGGAVAVMMVALSTVNVAGDCAPKSTSVAPVKVGAGDGHARPARVRPRSRAHPRDGRAGGGVYVYWSAVLVALVPPGW